MQTLLTKGANPNHPGNGGRTAVHRACLLDCLDQLDLLIQAGGSLDAIDEDRETPLHLAALQGHLGIVERLLDRGVDVEQRSDYGTPLDRAAFGGDVAVLAALLNGGAAVTTQSRWGRTPLHEAAGRGHLEAARLLLRRGADVNAVDRSGNDRTPLHESIYPGAAALVELLLCYGARIEARNSWGATPLHIAARSEATDVAEVLVEAGADRNARDRDGRTPLDEAAQRGHSQIVSLLERPQARVPTEIKSDVSIRHRRDLDAGRPWSPELSRNQDPGFRNHPDGQQRIERNKEARRILTGGPAYGSAAEIAAEMKVLPIGQLLKLDRIKRHQDLAHEVQWLAPEDDPLLILFVSHRWEDRATPDPHRTQLRALKAFFETFLQIAVGLKELRDRRLARIPTLRTHGALQATFFVGAVADYLDGFRGGEEELRGELLRRVGIIYDYMTLPQEPRTAEQRSEFLRGMIAFRRIVAGAPVLVLRHPDDEYSSRSWCELELWSAGRFSRAAFDGAPVLRIDQWGKPLAVDDLGPPAGFTSQSDFAEVLGALRAWECADSVTAAQVAARVLNHYHLAFSWKEKMSATPLITRPYFLAHNEGDISAAPPSFRLWHSIRERLCVQGLENEDFAEILKHHMRTHGVGCTEEADMVPTGLWLLGCHENHLDAGFICFYGRCLLRHLLEGKDLVVRLFVRRPDQSVHFKFTDGEEAIEG